MGETEICGTPKRIIVLGPYVLEPLLALNVQPVGYADHGSFHRGDYSEPSQQIPYLGNLITQPLVNVGSSGQPSIEALIKVKPDLILGTDISNADQYETLSKLAPTLLFDYYLAEDNLRTIAKAVNRPEQAEQLLTHTQQQIASARKTFASLVATHPKVGLLSVSELQTAELQILKVPTKSDILCQSLIEDIGFQRVLPPGINDDNSMPVKPISLETLPQLNDADLVILFGHNFSGFQQLDSMEHFAEHQLSTLKQAWQGNAIAQSLDASQAGRVYFIPGYLCAGLLGPIGTELYLEELKEQLLTPN